MTLLHVVVLFCLGCGLATIPAAEAVGGTMMAICGTVAVVQAVHPH